MTSTNKGIVLKVVIRLLAAIAVINTVNLTAVRAEPLLLVYPNSPAIFRYNPADYEELSPGHPDFDPAYAIGGTMLWDKVENRIPIEVYRAPKLNGFDVSPFGLNEYVTMINQFTLIMDGFADIPRQLNNLYIRFIPDPPQATAQIDLGGIPLDHLIQPIPGFNVTTPIGGGYYSDTQRVYVAWSAAVGIRITVYADKNGNTVYDGGIPRFSVYVRDNTVPVETTTWGGIKALYNR